MEGQQERTAMGMRLSEQVSRAIRNRHYSYRTEQPYLGWIKRFILFHDKRHPRELAEPDIAAFLSHLAVDRKVSASTQNQALNALLSPMCSGARKGHGKPHAVTGIFLPAHFWIDASDARGEPRTRRVRRLLGLTRSLLMYYGIPLRAARMRRFYAGFVQPGGLCFDIGAHVGNRVRAWRALGAKVVAVEPQTDFVRVLRALYGRDEDVTIVDAAVGAEAGGATLLVSERTPTVTTLSREWVDEVKRDPSFRAVAWSPGDTVRVTTLEALIEAHGMPAFVKIDVEGYEAEVLRGLKTALPCLSFEYLPAARRVALECIQRLAELGDYEYNYSVGESHRLARMQWCDTAEIRGFVEGLARRSHSGDIYARLASRA